MSQKLRPPKSQTAATPATLAVPRKTRSGPSSIPSWTSNLATHVVPRDEGRSLKTLAVAGLAGLLAIVVLAAYGGMDTTASRDLSNRKPVADDAGNLHVPDTYRTTYELLGSWAVAADQGQGSKQLHVVYASPGTIAAYRTDGRFPDGAVLVKEVFKAATGQMT